MPLYSKYFLIETLFKTRNLDTSRRKLGQRIKEAKITSLSGKNFTPNEKLTHGWEEDDEDKLYQLIVKFATKQTEQTPGTHKDKPVLEEGPFSGPAGQQMQQSAL